MVITAHRPAGALNVWANGHLVGTWWLRDQAHHFQYAEGWLGSTVGRPLSLSLPFTPGNVAHKGPVVRNFFDNLLPDNDAIRRRLRARYRTAGTDPFHLLAAIGRDCVGAVQLLPQGMEPQGFDRIDCTPLGDKQAEQAILETLAQGPALGQGWADHFRISIAGAQEKTALLRHDGRWCLPLGATPTTHILKLPLGLIGNVRADMRDSVENEWLCAQLLARFGLDVAHTEILRFGQTKVLCVQRFDRAPLPAQGAPTWIARLPQEDMCQALGVAGEQRYESDGGPGHGAILRLLAGSKHAQRDQLAFVKAQFLFWLMAATDGHAKNFSIFLDKDGYRLTPLYDVLSVWPIIGNGPNQWPWRQARLAMAVRSRNPHYRLHEIQARHWQQLAAQLGQPDAFDSLVALALQVPAVLEEARQSLPPAFPQRVFGSIAQGMQAQATRFVEAL